MCKDINVCAEIPRLSIQSFIIRSSILGLLDFLPIGLPKAWFGANMSMQRKHKGAIVQPKNSLLKP